MTVTQIDSAGKGVLQNENTNIFDVPNWYCKLLASHFYPCGNLPA